MLKSTCRLLSRFEQVIERFLINNNSELFAMLMAEIFQISIQTHLCISNHILYNHMAIRVRTFISFAFA